MITKDMIEAALCDGYIKFITSPNDDGVAVEIGDNWFYPSENYVYEFDNGAECDAALSLEDKVNAIWETLDEFRMDGDQVPEIADEYDYYDSYLNDFGYYPGS